MSTGGSQLAQCDPISELKVNKAKKMTARAGQSAFDPAIRWGIGLFALLLSSCGVLSGPTEVEAVTNVLEAVESAQTNVSHAVTIASSSGQSGSAEVQTLLNDTAGALNALNAATTSLANNPDLVNGATSYAQSANLVLGLLAEGNTAIGAEVARTQVDVKYASLTRDLGTRQNELGGPPSTGAGATWIVLIGVIIAAVAAIGITRRRPRDQGQPPPPPQYTPEQSRPVVESVPDYPFAELSSTLPPIGTQPDRPPAPTGPLRNPEAIHSVRGGLRTVELEGIIEAALATVTDTGWEVAIQCPQVRVLVDPLRMRRLLSNLLLSATAHGAEHIGLVAEVVGDKVKVNIGHDGTLLANETPGLTDEIPPEVDHQLTVARQLLTGMHAEARWTRWRGVSLYTIELVRGPDEGADSSDLLAVTTE